MLLRNVFIRFYKSFNFDYLKKFNSKAEAKPWEYIDDLWYPYVRIPIDPKVTTIVGANESGKSHLLTAIERGVTGSNIERDDFCRYSQFFAVEKGKLRLPEFGFEWHQLSEDEIAILKEICKPNIEYEFDSFYFFRTNNEKITIYIKYENEYKKYLAEETDFEKLDSKIPRIFNIDAKVALPDSVPIKLLAQISDQIDDDKVEIFGRNNRNGLLSKLFDNFSAFKTKENVIQNAESLHASFNELNINQGELAKQEITKKRKEVELVRKLILKVANIDPEALQELYKALQDGKEGHANGIIQKINSHLSSSLNFPHWWVQDKDFKLVVTPREYDLVFTIRDRTNTEYCFGERSSGLKYFLSYFVQYRSHEPIDDRPEILLMDEPDAYLSSQAQQDLLKIFQAFAEPDDGRRPIQVIYVTHSPFLIDKNHSERIRVLEKGVGEEGTRVVRDASKNHYEPLRSAFGAFVGETTFIGNCNLMVEGSADQILIAGAANHLRNKNVSPLETLDLNNLTIVPAGSASHIPYLVYLARGRDIERPAIIVLLDSDQSGEAAKKQLIKGGANNKRILKNDFILQIGDLQSEIFSTSVSKLTEIEDLVPIPICIESIRRYLKDICEANKSILDKVTEKTFKKHINKDGVAVFDAIKSFVNEISNGDHHIEKVGFARITIDYITEKSKEKQDEQSIVQFEDNMKTLFKRLNKMRRLAEKELGEKRITQRVERAINSFLLDHPTTAKREEALVLLEDIENVLEDSIESDAIKLAILNIKREFNLNQDLNFPINDYSTFKDDLNKSKYAARIATQEPSLGQNE